MAAVINGDLGSFYTFAQDTLVPIMGIEVGFLIAFILFTKTFSFFKEGILYYKYNRYKRKT